MDELENLPLAHFSKKIFFFSFLFLALNFAFFLLFFYGERGPSYRLVAPRLIFAGHQEVTLKTAFDPDFRSATSDQVVRPGTEVKTGPESFAELKLEGNTLRLDQNTQLTLDENHFEAPSFFVRPEDPRLSFTLRSGSVWVSAHEALRIKSSRSDVTFAQATGSVTYASSMNRVMVVTGGAELALKDQKGEVMTRYFIPFRHQVTFADSQITPSYSRLQASKLKKELKLAPLSLEVLRDDWIQRNQDQDLSFLASETKDKSFFAYRFWDAVYRPLSRFAFLPEAKRQAHLARLENYLQFLTSRDNETETKALLSKMDSLTQDLENDPEFSSLFAHEFYRLGLATSGSTTFQIKEALRAKILEREKDPSFLRTYLLDVERDLREGKMETILPQLERWQEAWETRGMKEHFQEFEDQSRFIHSLGLAYPPMISSDFLGFLSRLAEGREQASADKKETLFLVAEERLELSSALIAIHHYRLAKAYLQAGALLLGKREFTSEVSAREVLLERLALLTERIAFAEEELHGAAEPIDEAQFRNYLERKTRDKTLSESLRSFLESFPEEALTPPASEDVMERFSEARISVIAEDLEVGLDSPFEFKVTSARLLDRGPEGPPLFFSALYDYRTNAVHEIVVNDKPFKGNFELKDLVAVLTKTPPTSQEKKPTSLSLLMDFDSTLFADRNDAAHRAEIQAQDLAKQVVLGDFKKAGIELAMNSITVLNLSTLDQFKIQEVQLKNPQNLKQTVSLTFDFNLSSKKVLNAKLLQKDTPLPGSIALHELTQMVFETLSGAEQTKNLLETVYQELKSQGLLIAKEKLQAESGERVRFSGLSVPNLPVEVSGIYDQATKRFVEVSHELLQKNDISVEAYFNELAPLFVLKYLEEKGITVPPPELSLAFPFDRISVTGFAAGRSLLDFQVNLEAGRLENVSIQGTDSALQNMTFDEFKGVLKTLEESP